MNDDASVVVSGEGTIRLSIVEPRVRGLHLVEFLTVRVHDSDSEPLIEVYPVAEQPQGPVDAIRSYYARGQYDPPIELPYGTSLIIVVSDMSGASRVEAHAEFQRA